MNNHEIRTKDRWIEAFSLEMFHNPPQGARAAQVARSLNHLGTTLFLSADSKTSTATVTISMLAEQTGMSTRTVQDNLKRLEDAGWIERHKHRNNETGSTYNSYVLKVRRRRMNMEQQIEDLERDMEATWADLADLAREMRRDR